MADRRMDSPDQRDVSAAVRHAHNRIDVTAIAFAILNDQTISACIDPGALHTDDLVHVLSYAVPDAIDENAITDAIVTSLRDCRSSSEPDPPQPSSIVDATMLREQILGMLLPIFLLPLSE
jgi:hypothetical protein